MLPKSPIILSVLTHDAEVFAERIALAQKTTKSVHLDVIDGHFCEGRTLPVDAWPVIDMETSDAHLMVNEPLEYLEALSQKKVTRAIVHVESKFDPAELANKARELDILLGWAVNPDTDLDILRPLYEISTYVQVMGVHPGRSGQEMLDTTIPAVAYLRRIPSRRLVISVDGGVSPTTIPSLKQAGANYFVTAHAIFDSPSPEAALAELTATVQEAVRK